jgi:hypothetical protein
MSSTAEAALEDGPQELDEAAVRADFDGAIAQDGRALTKIAPEVGIAYGTLSAWRGGTYAGDGKRITLAAKAWLLQRVARARAKMLLPAEPAFMMTKTASRIWDVLEFAQTVPTMGLVVGGAGVGKTTAFEGYQQQQPNTVWIATMQPCHRTIASVLQELQVALRIPRDLGMAAISRSIVRRLRGTAGLVIIDEAQHLSSQALDQIRSLADATKIGFVVGGGNALLTNMGMRFKLDRPLREDIGALLDAWKIEAPETRQELTGIALKPGGGRVMTMILRIAFGLAGMQGVPLPTVEHVRTAWQQIGATTVAA